MEKTYSAEEILDMLGQEGNTSTNHKEQAADALHYKLLCEVNDFCVEHLRMFGEAEIIAIILAGIEQLRYTVTGSVD